MMPWEEYAAAGYGDKPAKQKPEAARAQFADAASAALGVPREVILAHTALETGRDGAKTVGAYNYGNIKAQPGYRGASTATDAKEFDAAGRAYVEKGAGFRAYQSPDEAAADYVRLIKTRYPAAAAARTPEEFAAALKAGGYATDPQYVAKFAAVARSQAGQRVGTEKGLGTNTSEAETTPQKMPWEEYAAAGYGDKPADPKQQAVDGVRGLYTSAKSTLGNVAAGALRGAGSIGATILQPIDYLTDRVMGDRDRGVTSLVTGKAPETRNEERRRKMTEALGTLGADTDSTAFKAGKVGGEIAGTAGAGGALAQVVRALAPALAATTAGGNALTALSTGGLSAGTAGGATSLGLRALGGATVGYAGSKMTGADDGDAQTAAMLGGVLPVGLGAAGKVIGTAADIIKPLTGAGQSKIVGDILRTYAHDPEAALAALQRYRQVVPGSEAITSAAAGDVGLSGLTRTMQAANPQMANELAMRAAAQNTARTGALEGIAGNSGQIAVAKEARNALTGPMREDVLRRAGSIDAQGVLGTIDTLIANPNNAGSTARQALERVRSQVAGATDAAGAIDPRALYEIRKDIGLAMQGKLSGDAGNLRYAKGVLNQLQEHFDDAIGSAARRAGGSAPNLPAVYGQPSGDPWREYLQTYARESQPITRMERLHDVLQRAQTGSTDLAGNLQISPAKLNNILKTDGEELAKLLTPEQMQTLRNVSADANAGRLGLEAGRSLGSNTAQNLSQTWLLRQILGRHGESPLVSSVMKRPLGILYGGANERITDQLTNALLDPALARDLMARAAPQERRMLINAGLLGSSGDQPTGLLQ